jgi:membrane-bound lytic murein transglycosylase D
MRGRILSPAAWTAAVLVCALTAACGNNPRPQSAPTAPVSAQVPAAVPQAPPAAAVPPIPDPIGDLIATSQRHFDSGERALKAGHLDQAREEFDASISVLLDSPYGARTDARLREHFDRLVDRINAYEV